MFRICILILITLLTSCSPYSDLEEWVKQVKSDAANKMQQASKNEPIKTGVFTQSIYDGLNAFDPKRLLVTKSLLAQANAPDLNRSKEILESKGLGSIRYVGFVDNVAKNGKKAYLEMDGHIYTVQIGNYVGNDFGKIILITRDKIVLEESIENAQGEWVKREAEILLAEK